MVHIGEKYLLITSTPKLPALQDTLRLLHLLELAAENVIMDHLRLFRWQASGGTVKNGKLSMQHFYNPFFFHRRDWMAHCNAENSLSVLNRVMCISLKRYNREDLYSAIPGLHSVWLIHASMSNFQPRGSIPPLLNLWSHSFSLRGSQKWRGIHAWDRWTVLAPLPTDSETLCCPLPIHFTAEGNSILIKA